MLRGGCAQLVTETGETLLDRAGEVLSECLAAVHYLETFPADQMIGNFGVRERFTSAVHDFAADSQTVLGTSV